MQWQYAILIDCLWRVMSKFFSLIKWLLQNRAKIFDQIIVKAQNTKQLSGKFPNKALVAIGNIDCCRGAPECSMHALDSRRHHFAMSRRWVAYSIKQNIMIDRAVLRVAYSYAWAETLMTLWLFHTGNLSFIVLIMWYLY